MSNIVCQTVLFKILSFNGVDIRLPACTGTPLRILLTSCVWCKFERFLVNITLCRGMKGHAHGQRIVAVLRSPPGADDQHACSSVTSCLMRHCTIHDISVNSQRFVHSLRSSFLIWSKQVVLAILQCHISDFCMKGFLTQIFRRISHFQVHSREEDGTDTASLATA